MKRTLNAPRKLRSQLLLSASLLTTGLVTYGRPAFANCVSTGLVDGANTYLCSGASYNQTLASGSTPITVIADGTADFGGAYYRNRDLEVYGATVTIEVREGATFETGITARSSEGTPISGVDIDFNGEIDQNSGFISKYGSGIEVFAKYGDTHITTGSGDITLSDKYGRSRYHAGIRVSAYAPGSGDVDITTGAGNISGGKYGIDVNGSAADNVTIETGTGSVQGRKYGIQVNTNSGDITVTTGDGDISAGDSYRKYGRNAAIGARTNAGNIVITTGNGDITSGGIGIDARSNYGSVQVTTGAGNITSAYNGINAHGSGTTLITTGAGDITSDGNGIDAYSKYGTTQITTGDGNITSGKYGIDAHSRDGSIEITTGAGAITGDVNGIYAEASVGNIQITTGDGNISGSDKYGISAQSDVGDIEITTGNGDINAGVKGNLRAVGVSARSEDGEIRISTGSGDINSEGLGVMAFGGADVQITTGDGNINAEYGVAGQSLGGNVQITTGSGTVGTRDVVDGPQGSNGAVFGFASNGDVDITIGEGGANGRYGVVANAANTTVTVNGDIFVNQDGNAAISTTARGEIDPMNQIAINSGVTVDASNGVYGVRSKYGSTEIVVAGELIGGSESAIRTNGYFSYDPLRMSVAGQTRVEIQSGAVITGAVIAGGERTDDVLALGGSGELAFDLSLINTTQLTEADQTVNVQPEVRLEINDGTQYFNFDQFEKVGSGTAILSGTNAEVDNFAVREGTLQLNGAMAEAMAVDLIDGQVTGMGRIGSLIARSGTTVSPGIGDAFATLEVAQDLTFETGSTLSFGLNAQGESDLLDVDGSATIGTDVSLAITGEAGDYSSEDLEWTVISATGGVTGTFGDVSDNLLDVEFVDVYDNDTVTLTATVATDAEMPSMVAGVSDKSNGPVATVGAGFTGLAFAQKLNKVPRQSDADGGSISTSSFNIDTAHFSSKGDGAVMPSFETANTSVFFGTFTEDTNVSPTDTSTAYDISSTGLMGGVSYNDTLSQGGEYQLNLGFGYTGAYSETEEGYADSTSFHFGLGGAYTSGPLLLSGAMSYSRADIDLARQVGSATATAQTDARVFSAVVEASYDVASSAGLPEGARLAPMVRLRSYSATSDAYTETGAGILNLNVEEVTSEAVYAGVGFQYSGSYDFRNTTLKPNLSMIYDSKVSGGDTNAISTIDGVAGAFDTSVNTGPDHLFSIDLGVSFDIDENVEGFVNYGTTFGEDIESHHGMVGLTINF